MDQITATDPNWVVEIASPSTTNARQEEVEQLRSKMETEEQQQPLPEHLFGTSLMDVGQEEEKGEQDEVVIEETSLVQDTSAAEEHDQETEVSFQQNPPFTAHDQSLETAPTITVSQYTKPEDDHSAFHGAELKCDEERKEEVETDHQKDNQAFQETDSSHEIIQEEPVLEVNEQLQQNEAMNEDVVEDQVTVPKQEMETQGEVVMERNETVPKPNSTEEELVILPTEMQATPEPIEEQSHEVLVEDNSSASHPVEEAISSLSLEECPPVNPVNIEISSPASLTQLPLSSTSPSSRVDNTPPGDMLHHIKSIQFKDKKVGIVTQNENGPCPLVAIVNILLLRRQITLPAHSEIVSAAKLMEYIGDTMLESVPKNLSSEVRLNFEQNMNDAMAVLPKLQTGLDVNVKFTGVRDFEYTPECIIFDLLRIPLFHGWLVDPQTPEVVAAVGTSGYNQLVEKVISQKCSNNEDAVTEALVIENFLERSASQLTYHGLSELTTSMNEDEIGVLFRNNHFSTIYKHQKELLQLVTDQGFLGESNVVWETLGSIDGDGQFVDSHFRTVPPKQELEPSGASGSPNTSTLSAEQQIDHDFLVALSLQEEQQQEQPTAAVPEEMIGVGEDVAKTLAEDEKTTQELLDLELARQLQEEEERQAAEEAETAEREAAGANPPQPASGSRSPSQPSKTAKEKCTFL